VHYPLKDDATQLLATPIEVTANIIKDELAKDGCVLVHCTMGISRAPAIVMGYLMTAEGLSFDKTKELVFSARSRAEPNFSFMAQLAQLSKISPI
jgi:protein-tyrosine phosphatase